MYNNKNAMAESVQSYVGRMRDYPESSDFIADNDNQSNHGDPEDIQDRDPDYMEERFRVDRRKLEQMLQGMFSHLSLSLRRSAMQCQKLSIHISVYIHDFGESSPECPDLEIFHKILFSGSDESYKLPCFVLRHLYS